MNEYRLAMEFWGSLFGVALVAPVFAVLLRGARELFCHLRDEAEKSAPLASVPSSPRPSWH
jgi:hypothetical protein